MAKDVFKQHRGKSVKTKDVFAKFRGKRSETGPRRRLSTPKAKGPSPSRSLNPFRILSDAMDAATKRK